MADKSIKATIHEHMKEAMRAKEKERLSTIRLIMAEIQQREVDEQITLDDAQVLAVFDKMIKQRRESIKQYTAGQRQDLADREQAEILILQTYLPPQLTDDEINQLVQQAIAEKGASSIKDMGGVMSALKPKLQGRADMGVVSALVRQQLNQ